MPRLNIFESRRRMLERKFPQDYCKHQFEFYQWRTTSGGFMTGDYIYPAIYKCKLCGATEFRER